MDNFTKSEGANQAPNTVRVILENIPAELKQRRQWVLWKAEPVNGKLTKVPYQPNGKKAQSNNPATWSTFENAVNALPDFSGLGIMFADDLVGVDLDHRAPGGVLDDFASRLASRLNSYTEFSPSGEGIHILACGKLPEGGRKKSELGLEMYDTGRFFTVTGRRITWASGKVEERTAELAELHAEIFKPAEPERKPQPTQPNNLDDSALLLKAFSAKNGEKVSRLFSGDTSDYPSASEADLALCNHLAFWTGRDAGRIDQLFRTSALMRDKWDERHSTNGKTYGDMTIQEAIKNTHDVYDPGRSEQAPAEPSEPAEIHNTTWADMQALIGPIEWSWQNWLPNGLLTILASESGTGKSALSLRIAGCYILGLPWPDGTPFTGETGGVLWCEAEAAQAINLERAKAWGLPLDQIHTPLANPLDDFKLDDPAHAALLMLKAEQPEIKLIIVDSLSGTDSKAEKSAEDAVNVKRLAELARNTGKPILVTHHLRKRSLFDGDKIDLDRLRGSSAIVQPARVVWALDLPDPQDKETKRLQVVKNNLAAFPEPVGMIIDGAGVKFTAAPEPPRIETVSDRAADLLISLLQAEPQPYKRIADEFDQAGISVATLKRVKSKLGVVSVKQRGDDGPWLWSLPAHEEPGIN